MSSIALGNSANSGKRCRAACDPFSADLAQCPTGNRCQLVSEDSGLSIKGFCQEGVCSEHTDCGINNGLNNYCTSVSNGTGSGFCLVGCEPLQCTYPNSCNDCPTSSQGCEPFDPDGTGAIAFGCFVPGNRSRENLATGPRKFAPSVPFLVGKQAVPAGLVVATVPRRVPTRPVRPVTAATHSPTMWAIAPPNRCQHGQTHCLFRSTN